LFPVFNTFALFGSLRLWVEMGQKTVTQLRNVTYYTPERKTDRTGEFI
jgi:hypothetical protein